MPSKVSSIQTHVPVSEGELSALSVAANLLSSLLKTESDRHRGQTSYPLTLLVQSCVQTPITPSNQEKDQGGLLPTSSSSPQETRAPLELEDGFAAANCGLVVEGVAGGEDLQAEIANPGLRGLFYLGAAAPAAAAAPGRA